jgi:hypothetical protein
VTNLGLGSDLPLAGWQVGCGVADKVGEQCAQIESPVKSVGEGTQALVQGDCISPQPNPVVETLSTASAQNKPCK